MKIQLSKQRAEKVRESIYRGHKVEVTNLGQLEVKSVPPRKAYHNFTGKKITIAGYKKIAFKEI